MKKHVKKYGKERKLIFDNSSLLYYDNCINIFL